jgi:simple sugar transport system permease protein
MQRTVRPQRVGSFRNVLGFRGFFGYRGSSVFLVFVGFFLLFTFLSPEMRFVRPDNLRILLTDGSEFSIVVLGVGLLMICGEFDLSVGSILVFCSFLFIRLFQGGVNLFASLAAALAAGAAVGFLNGIITVKGRIPSFITTLGTMMFWRGITLLLSEGFTAAFDQGQSARFTAFLTGEVGGIVPVQALWFVGIALALGVVLHFHRFGNWVYATGGNLAAARAMGIRTDLVKIACFTIVGILCAFVGVTQAVRVSSFFSRAGDGWELKAVAASVVGATALMGGRGSMAAIFLGALVISIIENALVMLRITYFWTYMVFGFVIIASLLFRTWLEKSRPGR